MHVAFGRVRRDARRIWGFCWGCFCLGVSAYCLGISADFFAYAAKSHDYELTLKFKVERLL